MLVRGCRGELHSGGVFAMEIDVCQCGSVGGVIGGC